MPFLIGVIIVLLIGSFFLFTKLGLIILILSVIVITTYLIFRFKEDKLYERNDAVKLVNKYQKDILSAKKNKRY